jgi:hypothetical protein
MTKIKDSKIIKLARMCKSGCSVQEIQRVTGVKSVYEIVHELKKKGANLVQPKNVKRKRDWEGLVTRINNL